MARRHEVANSIDYHYAADPLLLQGSRLRAILQARLLDELTGAPVRGEIRVSANRPGLQQRVSEGGIAGLTGVPARVFSEPDLATNAHSFTLEFRVTGYVASRHQVSLGPIAGFPQSVGLADLPIDLGDIALHRDTTVIRGRVLNQLDMSPVAGASVSVTSIFQSIPSPDVVPVPAPYELLSLRPPLYAAYPAGTGHCRRRLFNPIVNKSLLRPVARDTQRVLLSDVQGLFAGQVLLLDQGEPDKREYLEIASVRAIGRDTSPGWVEWVFPCHYSHRESALVQVMTPLPLGPDNLLGVAAIEDDSLVLLDSSNGIASGNVVELSAGASRSYHQAALFSTLSDSRGFFRLPPLSRVGQLSLQAVLGPATGSVNDFVPDYTLGENPVDIVIS